MIKILNIFTLVFLIASQVHAGTTLRHIYVTDATSGITARVESDGDQAVAIQDQHSTVIDLYMQDHGVVGGHGVIVGEYLGFKEDGHVYEGEVVTVAVNDITLDSPLDYTFTSASSPSHIHSVNMGVDGSVTTQEFHVPPPPAQEWEITRIIFVIEDGTVMDTSKFGGIAGLTNGVVLRVVNGDTKNFFNVKTNGELAGRSFDLAYDDKAPAGLYGLRCRVSFAGQSKRGVTIRLDGDTSDELQLLIQDDLTGLAKFTAIVQGHVVTD